jgi:PAS domain S-box-containing protein
MRKRIVMVVEDELIVAEDLTHWLASLGYTVGARASTGQQAVQRCEATRPDLVLMDILLPGDMDGIQAAEIIRQRFDIPVVYITASSDDATLSRAKVTEPFGYILKPFDERGLYSTIEMALYKHQSEKRIRNSEERFRLLYENAPVAFQSLDADGHLLQVNKAWQELFGYTQEEVNGHWFGEYLAPNSTERFIAACTQFRHSPITDSITLDVIARNGMRVSATFKGSIAVDHRGMFEMTQCVLESRLHPAADTTGSVGASPDDVSGLPLRGAWLLTSPDGVILGITPVLELLLGVPADRLCGMMFHDLCTSATHVTELLAQLTSTGTLDTRPLALRHAGGEPLNTTVTGFLLHGQGGMAGSCCLYLRKP